MGEKSLGKFHLTIEKKRAHFTQLKLAATAGRLAIFTVSEIKLKSDEIGFVVSQNRLEIEFFICNKIFDSFEPIGSFRGTEYSV